MEARTAPYHEMVNVAKNRSVLGTFSPELLRAAHYALIKAEAFQNERKRERILQYLGDTTGLDGRGREDLRDALMGARAPPQALGGPGAPQPASGAVQRW